MKPAALVVAGFLVGCQPDPETVELFVTPGLDASIGDETRFVVSVVGATDNQTFASVDVGRGTPFSFGELPDDALLRFEATGDVVGRTPAVVLDGATDGAVLPLFVQPPRQWGRPGVVERTHQDGIAAAIGERFLLLTGGSRDDAEQVTFYDQLTLGPASGGTLSFVPRTVVVSADGNAALFLEEERALWLDFAGGDSEELEPPTGLSWRDFAGGEVVRGPTTSFVLPGPAGASDGLLVVDPVARVVSGASLSAARRHPGATWAEGFGLVVLGGTPDAPGLELVSEQTGAWVSRALPYEPIASAGHSVFHWGEGDVRAACGEGLTLERYDLGCAADCAPTPSASVPTTLPLSRCRSFVIDGETALIVGDNLAGVVTSALYGRLDNRLEERPLREDRRGATTLATPNGSIAVLGGVTPEEGVPVLSVEQFTP
ncbi:MAG: hypothetical protein AAGA56_21215 [Myxococcota bacterium]